MAKRRTLKRRWLEEKAKREELERLIYKPQIIIRSTPYKEPIREIDARRRCHYVNKHRCKKYINEMHWRGLKEGHQVGYDSGYDEGFADACKEQE